MAELTPVATPVAASVATPTPTPAELSEELLGLLEKVKDFFEKLPLPIQELSLGEDHKATLKRLRELNNDDEEPVQVPGKKRKQAAGGGRAQWKRVIDLEDLVRQEASAVDIVSRFGDDAGKFLNSRGSTHRINSFPDEQTGDAFTTRYHWTMWRVGQKEASHVFTLFGYLFWFDFVKIIRPQGTGRVGAQMEKQIERGMKAVVGQIVDGSNLVVDDVARHAKAWSIRGRKLHQMCERYGDGVVLFLHRELSDDFLDNKYTATGQGHDEAFATLDELGLEASIRTSGAAALANNVREFLIGPFRRAAEALS